MFRSSATHLADKGVLITGGAHGIGAHVARRIAAVGARVAVLDRDVDAARRLAAELGSAAAVFEADVTSAESMAAACSAVAQGFGGIDVVVANAGIAGPGATVAAVDPAAWRNVIDVNLLGVLHTVQAATPYIRQRRGYIVAVASIAAAIPGPTVSGYVVSKAGVESLMRSVRIELAADGVDVGIAYFGLVDTGLAQQVLTNSGLSAVMAALPAAVSKPIPVDAAARAIAAGIERRARRIYAPRWVPLLLDLRPLLFLADRVLARSPRMRRVIRAAEGMEVSA
ncbi:short-chain dehydrogenase/reductase [Mycobacterium kyorinense]|uniref:Short-chain dehydrogenase n=1 Tax=Mycobacterium kyorinense TaxID=487514 RepID=A0A1X1XAT0_9MYCO|nr:short-chain dehydrogenase/reductase [Mycobacterium kyorinense]ORV95919.1 short-chain dehydrogenase [Mycobacterium kyorinense]